MLNIILFPLFTVFLSFFPFAGLAEGASSSAEAPAMGSQAKNENIKPADAGHASQEKELLSPEQTVDRLAAKSSNWQEPSKLSEERYNRAILLWLDRMQPQQREKAQIILREAHPELLALRAAIRDKKLELANMSFNRHTTPEALPRLGQELQNLRKRLRSGLEQVSSRLRREAGVSMGPLEGDAFWLSPQDSESGKPKASNKGKGQAMDKANSTNSGAPMFSMK